jgi:hypothetical protein
MTSDEFSDIEQLDENLRKWFKEKWVRFGPDGKIRGACARGDDSEGKPKCLPQKKAQNLGKKGRKYAASKKRREDPNPERTGKAKNVATKKKTNEGVPFNECPSCRGPIVHESMMNEKQDACYHKVKSRYKVWPSAYASGALVQCRKKGASNWGTGGKKKNESSIMKGLVGEAAYETDLNDNEPRVVIGVYGAKSKEFRKKFANQKAQDRFFDHPDREGNFEIHYVQKANMNEGVITQHDTTDPEVAILGGAGTMSLSRLKKKAHGEALQLADDIANGKYSASSYNMKQLHNTLNTIVAAEEEMEKSYFGEGDEMLDEAKMSDIVSPLVKQFNLENGAEARWANMIPLQVKHSFRRWRRGDGSYYTDPSRIEAFSTEYKGLQPKFFDWLLQQPGVQPAGKIRGEFRSDDYSDAVKYKGLIFINRGAYTEFTTTSRLRNSDVWHQKTDEDYTGMFAAEKTAATNPYGGQKDRQFRGAIGEEMDEARQMSPALKAAQQNLAGLASGEVQRQEKQRKAAEKAQRQSSQYLDRVLNRKPAKKSKQDLQTLWAKIESVIANSFPDGDPYDQLWPYMQKNGFTQDDVERASKMNGYKDLWDYWNTLTQDIENDAYGDWLATGGKNVRTRGTFMEEPTDNPTGASGEGGWRKYKPKSAGTFKEDLSKADVDGIERFADKLYKKLGIDVTFTKHFMDRVNDERNGKPISGAELVRLFKKEYERWGKDVAQMGPGMEGTFKDLTTDINLPFVLRWDRDEEELDLVAKTIMRKKNFKTHNQEFPVDEDTAYAGGMGQGGSAGQSYRKFTPKNAGTFKEDEQLDELKCWSGYTRVKGVPAGAPGSCKKKTKESAIMKGLRL